MNNSKDFKFYYNQATQLKAQGDIQNAISNILDAIKIAESVNTTCTTEDVKRFFDSILLDHKQFADMYFKAGEWLAIAGDTESSLHNYKLYQYYNSFINIKIESSVRFYSFRKFKEHTLSDLINNEITVCRSTAMNDPVDSLINLWAQEDNLKLLCDDMKHIATLVKSFDYYRIRSFCHDEIMPPVYNPLMWAHYADEHKGFCIKYRLSEHFVKQEEMPEGMHMYIRKIDYAKDSEVIDIRRRQIDTKFAFATKSIDWEYEDEARLIVYDPNNTKDFLGIKLDKDSSVEAIFFGYRCPKSTIKTIMNIFRNKLVKFYKMKVKPSDVYHFRCDEILEGPILY